MNERSQERMHDGIYFILFLMHDGLNNTWEAKVDQSV